MVTPSPALREELFQLELQQIALNARMRNGVVWAFIGISICRGVYEYYLHGAEQLEAALLYAFLPASLLGLMGFPLVRYYARKAEEKVRAKFAEQPKRRDPEKW